MPKTLIGLYEQLNHAKKAVRELIQEGFERKQIRLTVDATAEECRKLFQAEHHQERTNLSSNRGAAIGSGIGGAIGGLSGILLGTGLLALPGLGAAESAGPVLSAFVGLVLGATLGGVSGARVNRSQPAQSRNGTEAIGSGSLVFLTAEDDRVGTAQEIMNQHDPIEVTGRAAT